MIKKIFISLIGYFILFETSFAWFWDWLWWWKYKNWNAPTINCKWLPWCDYSIGSTNVVVKNNAVFNFTSNVISNLINYVAVFAVLALIISWIMYILSGWDEDKTKTAKNWIIWSLVWVFLSISAWSIISIINNFSITN